MKPGLFAASIIATFVVGFAVGRVSAPPPAASGASSSAPMMGGPPVMPPISAPEVEAPAMGGTGVAGVVAEVIQVPNYTYLRITTAQGDQWAAVSSNPSLQKGQTVRLGTATQMTGFTSKTLNRTFDTIWFGELDTGGGGEAPTGAPPGQLPPGHPSIAGGSAGNPAANAVAAVEQAGAALALRVADVYSEKAMLAGKRVRISGTAAKVTSVQGTFYVHLKDGSGAAGKDDDLLVITSTDVKADQPVTLEGRVALDKDVGMGSAYPVVVESATVVGH